MGTIIGSMEGREEAQIAAHDHVPTRLLKAAAGYVAVTFLYIAVVLATGHAPHIPLARDRSVSRTAQELSTATPLPATIVNHGIPAPAELMMPSPAPAMSPSVVTTERFPVAPAPPSSLLPPPSIVVTYHQAAEAFAGGVAQNVTVDATGELALRPTLRDDFSGDTPDSSQWQVVAWGRGGGVTVRDGTATMNIAAIHSRRAFLYRTFAVRARFTAGPSPFQNIAWSADLNGATAILIGVPQVDPTHLYARVKRAGEPDQMVQLPVALDDGAYHVYQIAWGPHQVDFSVDGVRCATIAVALDSPMYAWVSSASNHPLTVDWAQVLDYSSTAGNFTSAPIDAGASDAWRTLTLHAVIPSDTRISVRTRTSVNGEIWSAYSAIASDGVVTSPPGRYIQVEIGLAGRADSSPTISGIVVDAVPLPQAPSSSSTEDTIGIENVISDWPRDPDRVHEPAGERLWRLPIILPGRRRS